MKGGKRKMLEQMLISPRYEPRQQVLYTSRDLESTGLISLYTNPIGSIGSGFTPGQAPCSIQRNIGSGLLERYRAGKHEDYGLNHINLEYYVPGIKKPLVNIHIKTTDDE